MVGPVLIVLVLLIAIPVGALIGGAVLSFLLGWMLKTDVDQNNEGSELLELNV